MNKAQRWLVAAVSWLVALAVFIFYGWREVVGVFQGYFIEPSAGIRGLVAPIVLVGLGIFVLLGAKGGAK